MRHLPWVILTNVVAAILTIVVVSAAVHSGLARFGPTLGVADYRILGTPVFLSSVIAVLAGAGVFGFMTRSRRVMTFTDEVIGELFKVSWPTRDETLRASITVVATTAFTAGLLAAYDYLWKNVADYVFFNPDISTWIVGFLS